MERQAAKHLQVDRRLILGGEGEGVPASDPPRRHRCFFAWFGSRAGPGSFWSWFPEFPDSAESRDSPDSLVSSPAHGHVS